MLRRRFAVLFFIFLLTISLLALRLGQIGVGWGSELTRRAVNQRAVTYPLQSPRGQILDRNLVTLTAPEYHYSLVAFPSLLRDPRQTMVLLEQELDQSSPDLLTEVAGKREPLVIRRALTNQEREGVTRLALPGLVVIQEEERYGQNSLARHLVGYVSADGHGLAGLEKEF
ncbi:MAG: hypothetical protein M1299_11140, partial [Firmicutes bacterium]|nr:hypothetical protein [Bacillota bacterium]